MCTSSIIKKINHKITINSLKMNKNGQTLDIPIRVTYVTVKNTVLIKKNILTRNIIYIHVNIYKTTICTCNVNS